MYRLTNNIISEHADHRNSSHLVEIITLVGKKKKLVSIYCKITEELQLMIIIK